MFFGCSMRQIIRTKQSGLILGIVLCLLGFAALLAVLWKTWPSVSNSANVFSALWSEILNGQMTFGSALTLKMLYVTVGGSILLVAGMIVLGLSRQIFHVSSGPSLLQCPYCKNQWKARRAMGWAECPYCRKFINPETVKKL